MHPTRAVASVKSRSIKVGKTKLRPQPCCEQCAAAQNAPNSSPALEQAVSGRILLSSRFTANARLQRAASGFFPIRRGETDTLAVALVQQTLADLGFPLSHGFHSGQPTGVFDRAMKRVVQRFQRSQQFPRAAQNGVVDRETLLRMDRLLEGSNWGDVVAASMPVAVGSPAVLSADNPMYKSSTGNKLVTAVRNSASSVTEALTKLRILETWVKHRSSIESRESLAARASTQAALKRWMKIEVTQADFKENLQKVIDRMVKNLAIVTDAWIQPDDGPDCKRGGFAWANPGHPELGIRCCSAFLKNGDMCRRDVITHERFHLVDKGIGDGTATRATRTFAQALVTADDLAQLVSQLYDGTTDACPANK